jgi:hypothetical protein
MKLGLDKSTGKRKCRGTCCKKNPDYISTVGRIKKGTTCVWIAIDDASGGAVAYYCRDCIDTVYVEMKKILNPSLWIFL